MSIDSCKVHTILKNAKSACIDSMYVLVDLSLSGLLAVYCLTHCILVDSSTVICWMSLFVILGVSGLFCHFYSIFDGKSC